MNDAEELAELKRLRDAITVRIERLERIRSLKGNRNGGIPSASLRPFVQGWIDEGLELQVLADKADLSIDTLYRILRKDESMVTETTADKVLTAVGAINAYNRFVPEEPPSKYYEE